MMQNIMLCFFVFCASIFILMAGFSLLILSEVITKEEIRSLFSRKKKKN